MNTLGQNIGSYTLLEPIGAGGNGQVFRALHPQQKGEFALKMLKMSDNDKNAQIRLFERETQRLAQLKSPYIVPIVDFWADESGAYIVMPYLRGGNLRSYVQARGQIAVPQALAWFAQIGEGIHTAHEQGILHGDIKLDNVLLDDDGNALVSDFGTMMHHHDDTTIPMGAFAYLAPEQITQERISAQTDIYTLAILLVELLTGVHPYGAVALRRILINHLHAPFPNINERRAELPPHMNRVIQRASAKNPQDRYPNILAMLDDLANS
jgi:serine/threonine-protein kinase